MRVCQTLKLMVLIGFGTIGCAKKMEDVSISVIEKHIPLIRDSIYFSPYGGYGYDIIVNGEVKIHQPGAPGMRGNIGFSSAEDAKRTAGEAIDKMKFLRSPEVITLQELKALIAKSQQ